MSESTVRGLVVGGFLMILYYIIQFIRRDPERVRRAKILGKVAAVGALVLLIAADPRDGPFIVGVVAVVYALWWVFSGGKKKRE